MCVLCAVFVCNTQTQDPHQRCLPLSAVKKGPIELLKILPLCIFVCYIQKISMKMYENAMFLYFFFFHLNIYFVIKLLLLSASLV